MSANLTKGVLAAFTTYVVAMIVFKIALAMFYLRIVVKQWHKTTVYTALAVNTVYGVVYVSAGAQNWNRKKFH